MRVSVEVAVCWGSTTLAAWTRRAPWRLTLGEGGFAVPAGLLPAAAVTLLETDRRAAGAWLTLLPRARGTITWPHERVASGAGPRTTAICDLRSAADAEGRVWLPAGARAEIALAADASPSPYRSDGAGDNNALAFHVAVNAGAPRRPPRFGRAGRAAAFACASALVHFAALTAAAVVMPPLADIWEEDEVSSWRPPESGAGHPRECSPPPATGALGYGQALESMLALHHRGPPEWPGCGEEACCVLPAAIAVDEPDTFDHDEGEVPEVARCFATAPANSTSLRGVGEPDPLATRRSGVARFGRFDLRVDDEDQWVRSAVERLRPRLENCYTRALIDNPGLLGGLEVDVKAEEGSADRRDSDQEVHVTVTLKPRGNLRSERLMCCVAEVSEQLGDRMVHGRLRYSVGFRPVARPAR